ncbi:ABC transporter permease subunit [Roseospira visakhapatnamensis]|uniref:Putrescine transport system permease protein n=1 Tax=Roseospira visakhapatnamensis TaxID=390880 RepID=A0A7W6RDN0_9PROT|nr:ABC transporter permease subunit [Roseospira visakhapatnamensis]MBB4266397.1 putrescine transport system permease protein [Roseospira visakhapatnamensis]
MQRRSPFLIATLAFGFAFLYGPILLLILYSFNESRLVTVWGGFSTKWYAELFRDEQILDAALVSLRVGVFSATIATVLGTLSALMMVRFGRFRGRLLFTGMITAPLVMPEVITGLSLLLLFVALETAIGWPAGRGVDTITIAHTTFCMAYVTVVVRARLAGLDRSVEEAAMDLGARPLKAFLVITLPMLMPALVSGWLLGFTLSLDDLVIASFVAGPSSTTLPMVVFSSVRLGISPKINALATLLVILATVTILIAAWILWRQERERDRAVSQALAEDKGRHATGRRA